jgi:hypothetical protein
MNTPLLCQKDENESKLKVEVELYKRRGSGVRCSVKGFAEVGPFTSEGFVGCVDLVFC